MNMINIIHIIESSTIRVNISFYDTDIIKNIYVFSKNNVDDSLFKGREIYIVNDLENEESYDDIIKLYNPQVIIFAKKSFSIICTYLKNKHKIQNLYHIHHGFWNRYTLKKICRQYVIDCKNYTKVFLPTRNYLQIKKYNISGSENIYPINGLTQIDYLLSIDLNKEKIIKHNSNKKSILFISNYRGNNNEIEYKQIINTLKVLAKKLDLIIYVKPKNTKDKNVSDYYTKTKYGNNIRLINQKSIIYNYFFCDIIIIQTTGTSLLESLILNKPTILCQILDNTDYMDVKKYKNIPQANNIKKLEEFITTIHNNNYVINNDKYENERQTFIEENIGKLENVTEKIMETIIKDCDIVM